jgi:hypothetical protein
MVNWQEIYKKFLEERKSNKVIGGTHKHHIIPRYEQGTNEESNLVRLSIKNHATAHWIRYKWLGKMQDKVAWLLLSGKTEEGELQRKKLCLIAYPVEKRRKLFLEKNPMFNTETVDKAKETKKAKYNGKYHSEKGLARIRELCNSGNQQSREAIEKRVYSCKQTKGSMTRKEYFEKFIKNHTGEKSSQWGVKRPGELAGNYGKSKGTYTIIHPDKSKELLHSLMEALEKYDEGTLKRNRNTGTTVKGGKLKGSIINYVENINYGNNKNKIK